MGGKTRFAAMLQNSFMFIFFAFPCLEAMLSCIANHGTKSKSFLGSVIFIVLLYCVMYYSGRQVSRANDLVLQDRP